MAGSSESNLPAVAAAQLVFYIAFTQFYSASFVFHVCIAENCEFWGAFSELLKLLTVYIKFSNIYIVLYNFCPGSTWITHFSL